MPEPKNDALGGTAKDRTFFNLGNVQAIIDVRPASEGCIWSHEQKQQDGKENRGDAPWLV
jgi:hypothetical protein